MGASVPPEPAYSPDNPFAQAGKYSPENPFAGVKHNKPKIGQMGHAITTDESVEAPNRRLGTIASLVRDIPGAEAAQAGVRALVRGQSYGDARSDIRGAEDAAPWQATLPARLAGGVASAAVVPGGPILQGARFGALSGALQSDPDVDLKGRVRSSGEGAAVGALAGSIPGVVKATGGSAMGAYKVVKDIAGILHGNPAAAVRLGTRAAPGIRAFLQAATKAAPEVAPAVEAAAPEASSVANVVAKQSHRTAAQFQNFAERMGQDPPQPQTLGGLLSKLRASQPNEPGNAWGDAEEAMGTAPHQQPDLEALLRASLNRLKPTN